MEKKQKEIAGFLSLKAKMFFVAIIIILPMIVLSIYQIAALQSYSTAYDRIVRSITYANNYNLNFKDQMDESMYKLVVEAETFDTISESDDLYDPYLLIDAARENFTYLQDESTNSKSLTWISRILHDLDTLEDRITEIKTNLDQGGMYEENLEMLESDIYILTELLQEEIQYYIYYESQNFEAYRQILSDKVGNVILTMVISLGSILIISVLSNILLAKSITHPISKLCEKTGQIAKGDFSVRATCDSKDEIEVLADSFNYMAGKLEMQMEKIRQEQENLRNTELKLLQTQINPHFLYNTLDTIIWMIEGKQNEEAIDMIESLSLFFRIVVSKGRDYISIREEELHIESYLRIQQSRYKDILDYEIDIPDELYAYQTLKLTLQPLIENSLYHGIKMLRKKGKITIKGELDGDKIHLYVIDNGVGMSKEIREYLQNAMKHPENNPSAGFGLTNVDERIKLNYGENFGVEILETMEQGTTICVTIPAIKIQKDDNQTKMQIRRIKEGEFA